MKMAPVHMKALLSIATDPTPQDVQPSVLIDLVNAALVEWEDGVRWGGAGQYQVTGKANTLIRMWCETPMPERVERWMDPREKGE